MNNELVKYLESLVGNMHLEWFLLPLGLPSWLVLFTLYSWVIDKCRFVFSIFVVTIVWSDSDIWPPIVCYFIKLKVATFSNGYILWAASLLKSWPCQKWLHRWWELITLWLILFKYIIRHKRYAGLNFAYWFLSLYLLCGYNFYPCSMYKHISVYS